MTYFIKIHFISHETQYNILTESYIETLNLLGKNEKDSFIYDDSDDEPVNNSNFFYTEGLREIGSSYYNIVKVNFIDILEDEIDEFQENFLSFLKDKVQFIYKFEDTRLLEIRTKFFKNIYEIETNLREVVSFIFFTTYYDVGDFLKDLRINDITGKLGLKQADLRENLENEFFYISFSDYKNLLELRDLKESEKTELMKDSYSFEDWKKRIFERGIKDEPYIDFINSIKQDLEILEKFRNAIMHNHSFTDKLKQNYEKSKDEILIKIKEFRNIHINIFGNELGLIIGKKYKYIGKTTDNFINGKKYKLVELYGSDSIFEGEIEKNSIPYWDKEFYQYWSE